MSFMGAGRHLNQHGRGGTEKLEGSVRKSAPEGIHTFLMTDVIGDTCHSFL